MNIVNSKSDFYPSSAMPKARSYFLSQMHGYQYIVVERLVHFFEVKAKKKASSGLVVFSYRIHLLEPIHK